MSKKKNQVPTIRSSAAEYLTFVAAVGDTGSSVEMRYEDENIWLTQKMMATLYDVSVSAVNQHLKRIFTDNELEENSVIKQYLTTAADGKNYNTRHYSLQAIIAVGFKIENERAVQFRKWANGIVKDYTIQGWTMDEERLKAGGSVLDNEFFERQLEKIREIRLSERKFYQKITDIYATSIDYDVTAQATKRFFATVQNKLHWAIHGQTAAEVIYTRADAEQANMGLTTWKDAPEGKIQQFDVSVAKNYLSKDEMVQLQRLVNAYLDVAEDMALRKIPMTMADWEERLNRFIAATDREILQDAGKVTAEISKTHAISEFEKYRIEQDRLYESDFDKQIKALEKKLTHQHHPNESTHHPGEAPRHPNEAPRHSNEAPRHSNEAPRHSNEAPRHPGEAPRHPGEAPRHPGEAPRHPGEAPRHPGEAPRHPGEAPLHPGEAPRHPGEVPRHSCESRNPEKDGGVG